MTASGKPQQLSCLLGKHSVFILGVLITLLSAEILQKSRTGTKLGDIGPSLEVDFAHKWIDSDQVFWTDYVAASKPLLFKGVVKSSPAFTRWNDSYFLNLGDADSYHVVVETRKKEKRNAPTLSMTFRDFILTYRKTSSYLVDTVPNFLRKDIILPKPLQCPAAADTLLETMMWFSNGGTKSLLHYDAVDNINCLFRGKKEFVLIDPQKYAHKVNLDHPEGSYVGVDVDRVDYEKYPGLAEVEYYHVHLTAGDCLFVPFKWYHQVRSNKRNIAVNFWWNHHHLLRKNLIECEEFSTSNKSLDEYHFGGLNKIAYEIGQIKEHIMELVKLRKKRTELEFSQVFQSNRDEDGNIIWDMTTRQLTFKIFSILDVDKNKILTEEEIKSISDNGWNKIQKLFQTFEEDLENSLINSRSEL